MPTPRDLARLRELCEEIGPYDGLDPRLDRDHDANARRDNRKTRQLCGQIRRALDLALAASSDPVLQTLYVSQVAPGPDTSRLRVEVCSGDPDLTPPEALERLKAAAGWLRTEVAAATTRRRTPELHYAWGGYGPGCAQ